MRLIFVLVLLVTGCAPRGDSKTQEVDATSTEVRALQSHRTAQFMNLVGRGVIEFKWTDEHGTHKEQGDLDFWKQGDSISLRISKLGDLIAWFGGEGKHFWFFDMMGDEPTLTLGGEQGMFTDIDVALVLLGLRPLPDGELFVQQGVVTLIDEQNREWTATFDPSTHRPLDMKLVDAQHISKSLHRKGIRVEIANQHELYWPMTGGLIDFTDNRGNTEIKIVFASLSTIVQDEPMNRVMDLEYLRRALKPTQIVDGN